ncbi:integrase catalytic domain-containing protein [Trichonephila clavipes]|nr:integrase catalytic domain-containing protein [Trichonephila clavipes]
MEKIVSSLGNEEVLQPSSEELAVEPIPRSVALASKREIKVHPSKKINISDLVIPQGIVLADEGFNEPSEISCLIGSEHFFDIFGTNQIRVPNSNFRLIDSKFGYIVTGSYSDEPCYFKHCFLSKGDSRSIASKRLDQLWRRLDRDPKLNNLYTKFIEEYLSLEHMEEITNIDDIASEEGFFLPHHGVLRAGNHFRPLTL